MVASGGWSGWPSLPELFPVSFPGVKTSRDSFLVDIDRDRLKARIADYFNPDLDHEEVARCYPIEMNEPARKVRAAFLARGGPDESGFIRYAYRPFDNRWLYWETDGGLLDRPRPEYKPHVFERNLWLVSQQKPRREWSPPQVIAPIGCIDLMDRSATCIPAWVEDRGLALGNVPPERQPNLSDAAQRYLDTLGLGVEDLFHHVLAVLHNPAYREANAGALLMGWPRIPLPGWPDGDAAGAGDALAASAARGRELAALLDSDTPVLGVTDPPLRPDIAAIAVLSTVDGGNMTGGDFAVTASWGHFGQGDAVMPGQGRALERQYTSDERHALLSVIPAPSVIPAQAGTSHPSPLGETTFDVYLNDRAYWRNVPAAVWEYKLGGYQVLKKWLSYRESKVLGRSLLLDEVQHFSGAARRIAAILLHTASPL